MVFHLGDLLFWAEYYRTAQDVGLLTIAVEQRRPVWINQLALYKDSISPRQAVVLLVKFIALFGLEALNRDLHFMAQLALTE